VIDKPSQGKPRKSGRPPDKHDAVLGAMRTMAPEDLRKLKVEDGADKFDCGEKLFRLARREALGGT
jgi:hypothetical protein